MENKALEILRIKKLMGLKPTLREGFYGTNKFLLMEATIIGEIMQAYKSILKKTTQELSATEKGYLKNLIDEYNLRFGDEYGNLNFTGKMDNEIRAALKNMFDTESDDLITGVFQGAAKRAERDLVAKNGIEGIVTLDQAFKDALSQTKITSDLLNADGEIASITDILGFIYQKGGLVDSKLPSDYISLLRNELEIMSSKLPNGDPVKKYMDDVIDQADEIDNPDLARQLSDEEVGDITNNLEGIKNSVDNPQDPIVIDVSSDFEIRFDDDDIGLGRTPESVRKDAINAVMSDMEKKCKVGFCKTMVAYWKNGNPKFDDMWSYIYKKVETGIKPRAQSRFYESLPSTLVDEYELMLKEYGKLDTPFTPDDYIKLGEEIYKKMKENKQLGAFGGTFAPFTDIGVFTSKDMLYRTLGYVTLGTDPFKGGWTPKGMWDRWWKMNLIWAPIVAVNNTIEAFKGSEDPTETSFDVALDIFGNTVKDTALLGFAPVPRIFLEGAIKYMGDKMGGSRYVDYPTLVKYLNKQHGWTENQVYDNIINKGYVRTFRDATPAYTQVSGATDVFAVANGKYEIVVKSGILSGIGSLIDPKVIFTPEGQLTPNPDNTKTSKIDREARNEIKKLLGDESWLSDSIAVNTITSNKKIDFDRQETATENGATVTILVYKITTTVDKKGELYLNYDSWVAAGKPELTSEENFNKYVKSKLL